MANKNTVANDNQNEVKEEKNMAEQNQNQNNQQVNGSEVKNPPAADNTQNNQPAPAAAPEPPKEGWFKRNWKKLAAGAGAVAGGALALFAAHQHGVATGFYKASETYSHLADSYGSEGGDDDDEDDLDDIPDDDITEI